MMLLEKGASLDIKDDKDLSAADFAYMAVCLRMTLPKVFLLLYFTVFLSCRSLNSKIVPRPRKSLNSKEPTFTVTSSRNCARKSPPFLARARAGGVPGKRDS